MTVPAIAERSPIRQEMARGAEPIVRFEGVQKSYDGRTLVVRDLNLEVARGEFLTLLGPSGSGKTTTLMMLAGFEAPTTGRICLDGQEINRLPPYKRGIGVVFQNYALFPHMTVADNVAFPLSVRGVSRDEIRARTERALQMVRLADFGRRRPAQLSGGQQQRVALARALVFEPQIILLDEPLGALDKQLRERMQFELKQMHQELGVTMIYVTHDQSEALTMSDRVAVFNDGVIQQLDPPEELYERPRNAFVAGFIGESNRLAGEVLAVDGKYCTVRLADGSVVKATNIEIERPGTATLLSVRPERIRLGNMPMDGDDSFAACVRDTIYLGDAVRVVLEAFGEKDFIVKVANDDAQVASCKGDRIWLSWAPEHCRAFKCLV